MRQSAFARLWGEGGVRLLLGDAIVVALLGATVAALSLSPGAGRTHATAEVRATGGRVMALDLARDGVTEVGGPLGVTRLEVQGGRVRVLSSPCPRQDCRNRGWISEAGEMLVCLPNEVIVRVPGARREAPDGVAQ